VVVRLGDARPVASAAELAEAAGLDDDAALTSALHWADEMAARNAALREQLSAKVQELEASRLRLLEAGDAERAALEDRLRRGAADRLGRLEAELASISAGGEPLAPDVSLRLGRALDQLSLTRVELDELARGLDPGLLTERGLEGALRDLADRSPVPVLMEIEPVDPGWPTVDRTLFYVASEALANIAKHAQAAHAWLRLRHDGGIAALAIEDDGVGGADPRLGTGLRGLSDRLDALGGTLQVTPRADGGTRLLAAIPLGSADPGA
jgi:signal transduction histidine kinase